MSSQFTDRAQEALAHASKFASRLKQGYVGTEHILAGLLKEQTGVAHKVLTDNHIEPELFWLRNHLIIREQQHLMY